MQLREKADKAFSNKPRLDEMETGGLVPLWSLWVQFKVTLASSGSRRIPYWAAYSASMILLHALNSSSVSSSTVPFTVG